MLRRVARAVVLAACVASSTAVHADSARATETIEEIVVTAQRYAQDERRVPVALTALPGAQLERRQVVDVSDLQYVAPNLTIAPMQGNSRTATIGMRGQGEGDLVPTADPAVGLYVDGVYVARPTGANLNLVDIERVEVLRGPQGTLFGRNTIGGAIDVIPNRPTDALDGSAVVSLGNYDRFDVTGVINVPVADGGAAARLAAQHVGHDGYGRSVAIDRDFGGDDADFVRAQLRLTPDSGWSVNLSGDVTAIDTENQFINLKYASPPATLVPAAVGRPDDSLANYMHPYARRNHATFAGGYETTLGGVSATATVPFGGATLKSISAYRRLHLKITDTDLDGTPYDLVTQLRHVQHQRQYSQELQAFGTALDGRLSWVVGAFYFDEKAGLRGLSSNLEAISNVDPYGRGTAEASSFSLYGQGTYAVTSRLNVTVGSRWVSEARKLVSRNAAIVDGVERCSIDPSLRDDPTQCRATLPERNFSDSPYTLAVDFTPIDDVTTYVKVSRGYRAGGYNFRLTNLVQGLPFDSERVVTYELGTKALVFTDRVRVNAAAFRADYDDIQLTTRVPLPTGERVVAIVNAGHARIDGGELELTALLGRARLSAAWGVTDARYRRLAPNVVGLDENSDFAMTPESTLALAADVPARWRGIDLNFHADYAWRDRVYFGGGRQARQGAYGLVNVLATAWFAGDTMQFDLWGRNVTDERHLVRSVAATAGSVNAIPGDPRTFGVTLSYRFGREVARD